MSPSLTIPLREVPLTYQPIIPNLTWHVMWYTHNIYVVHHHHHHDFNNSHYTVVVSYKECPRYQFGTSHFGRLRRVHALPHCHSNQPHLSKMRYLWLPLEFPPPRAYGIVSSSKYGSCPQVPAPSPPPPSTSSQIRGEADIEIIELPEGFKGRITRGGRWGIISTSWAPQLKILRHESMGGFLTHLGWSLIVEAI